MCTIMKINFLDVLEILESISQNLDALRNLLSYFQDCLPRRVALVSSIFADVIVLQKRSVSIV